MADATDSTAGQEPNADSGDRSIDAFSDEAQDYIKRLRQENAKHRNDRKAVEARLQELENAGKTEAQKRDEELVSTRTELTGAKAKLAKYEVAAEKGIPLHLADRLRGATKEELSADADKLAQDFGLTANGDEPTGRPGFDGGVRRPVSRPKTMNDLIRQRATGRI